MTIKVFLVEDSKQLQGVMRDLLDCIGNFTITGVTETEAEACLWLDENQGDWHLAVVDLILEQGTGMGVIARCKLRAPGCKVVVFSDYISPGIEAHCRKLGADAVFQKSHETQGFIDYCTAMAN